MITSNQNERIKQLRKLHEKKHRTATGLFAAEGEDLVRTALAAGRQPVELFCTEAAPADLAAHDAAVLAESAVLDSASVLGSGARVIGVFDQLWTGLSAEFALAVYLDAIADPGNVGTVLRSALAFSDGPVILGPGCADPYSPKSVRAGMGAVFTRPPARATASELAALPVRRVAFDGTADLSITQVARAGRDVQPTIVCIGAERDGLSAETLAAADVTSAIPMLGGGPESLNAAIAASIALYELGRALQTAVHEPGETASTTGIPPSTEN